MRNNPYHRSRPPHALAVMPTTRGCCSCRCSCSSPTLYTFVTLVLSQSLGEGGNGETTRRKRFCVLGKPFVSLTERMLVCPSVRPSNRPGLFRSFVDVTTEMRLARYVRRFVRFVLCCGQTRPQHHVDTHTATPRAITASSPRLASTRSDQRLVS